MCEHFRLVRDRDCGRANALISLGANFHHFISLGNMLASPRIQEIQWRQNCVGILVIGAY